VAEPVKSKPRRGRSASRELALQALYQWQLGGQGGQDVMLEFLAERMTPAADTEFFKELVTQTFTYVSGKTGKVQLF
jgi:transcription termination factor NusB